MRKLGAFLLANNRNAIIVAFISALLPLLHLPGGFIAAVVIGFVTLQKGGKAGAAVLAWVALPAIALLYLHSVGTFDVLLLRCTLVWIFAMLLRAHRSWPLVLEVAVLFGGLIVLGMHWMIPDVRAFWMQLMTRFFTETGLSAAWQNGPGEVSRMVRQLAPIATGVFTALSLMLSIVQLVVARWWQAALFNPGGFRREFIQIRFSRTVAVLALALLGGVALNVPVIVDIFPLVLLPFMMAGLSLMHYWVGKHGQALLLLLIFVYVALIIAMFYMVILLALIGFIDSWYDFRRKMAGE